MNIPIYTLPRVPGADVVTPWTTFCQSRDPFIAIGYQTTRSTSRWQAVERKKKFEVTLYSHSITGFLHTSDSVWYPTLDAARVGAARMAQNWAKIFSERARKESA